MLHRLLYRPTKTPHSKLPFGVRSAGHYRVPKGWGEEFPPRQFAEVWYTLDGEGRFLLRGEELSLKAGEAMVLPSGCEQRLQALSDEWEYRWFTLDGPDCNAPLEWFGLVAGVWREASLEEALFEALAVGVSDASFAGQKRCAAVALSILARIPVDPPEQRFDRRVEEAVRIINRRFADPSLDVNALASETGLHRSQLTRLFTRELGRSPSEYLKSLRLETGIALLKDSTLQIGEIAWRCGFREPGYFSRLIRDRTGKSPREIRKP